MRRALAPIWPHVARLTGGIRPWEIERLTGREVRALLNDLDRDRKAREAQAEASRQAKARAARRR